VAGILAAFLLLLACSGGAFRLMDRWLRPEPEIIVSTDVSTPVTPSFAPQIKSSDPKPVTAKPPEKKPTNDKPPLVTRPPADKPPPPVEEPKELALADNLPPGLAFQIVEAINVHREKAQLEPIFRDAKTSHGCQAHAGYLARNAPRLTGKETERKDEVAEWPGFSEAGRKSAHAALIAAEAPLTAIEQWLQEPARRSLLLEPRLRTVGAGFARNVAGQWFSVFDWSSGIDREPPLETASVTGAIVYPVPGQARVPLWFPGNETPDPLPEAKIKLAGYPITLTFPLGMRVDSVTAKLSTTDERDIALWLSSPEKPANPRYADSQRSTICLIAKQPLRPNTRYHIEVTARVNGEAWSAKWGFTTLSEGEIHHDMAGKVLRTLNTYRRRAGLQPVPLDEERSKACLAHALYLAANAPGNPMLNWSEEKRDLSGYTEAGAALARRASIQGGGGPVEAVTGLVHSLIGRSQLLDPHLRALGLGYTPFAYGGWLWVLDLERGRSESSAIKEYLYPASNQKEVPLMYPLDEEPSPIPPDSKSKEAGYAITAEFVSRVTVTAATAKLLDGQGASVEGWLTTPQQRAIADYPQRSICFLPKKPLKPDTRYTMTFKAEVDGQPWEKTWSFTTLKQPNRFADDLDDKLLARVNAVRKTAGLQPVRLDASLSEGCQRHAHYLSVNAKLPAAQGLAVHRENATLTGATPEGARAAKASVIAVVLDPQTCVDGWMATLYHRIPILTPDLERIGFGHARIGERKWACVLDTGNGRKGR